MMTMIILAVHIDIVINSILNYLFVRSYPFPFTSLLFPIILRIHAHCCRDLPCLTAEDSNIEDDEGDDDDDEDEDDGDDE